MIASIKTHTAWKNQMICNHLLIMHPECIDNLMEAMAAYGEWQQLQSEIAPGPKMTASTPVTALTLTDEVLMAAMQWDDNVEGNLWWWHAARGAYFHLREREPFYSWQPSKLWRWLQSGQHIRVAKDHGELIGAESPFVILVHGSCRAVQNVVNSARGTSRARG